MLANLLMGLVLSWEPALDCLQSVTTGLMELTSPTGVSIGCAPVEDLPGWWDFTIWPCDDDDITITFTSGDVAAVYIELTTENEEAGCPELECFFVWPNSHSSVSQSDEACMFGATAPDHQYMIVNPFFSDLRIDYCVITGVEDFYFGNFQLDIEE